MSKAIILGANGQDGYYISHLLENKGVGVTGVSRGGNFLKTDIVNKEEINSLIKTIQPQYIFHLAANSTTNHNALFENHDVISTGTINILEAVKNFSPSTKVFIACSGLQWVNSNNPSK